MAELKIIYRNTADLIPYANNARMHSDEQIAQIAASIKEFGFNNPILLDGKNGIVAGHGRLLAAKKLNLKTVPCIDLEFATDAQRKAYILADNRLAENATWDDEILKLELEDITEFLGDDILDTIGFTLEENPIPDDETEPYTDKLTSPQYEPLGEHYEIKDLVDTSKADNLIADIQKADLPEDIKEFLIKAASRHYVFDYRKIAEFYAEAEPEVQELMERSALVIIDFRDAIKNGFVTLNSYIKEHFADVIKGQK